MYPCVHMGYMLAYIISVVPKSKQYIFSQEFKGNLVKY